MQDADVYTENKTQRASIFIRRGIGKERKKAREGGGEGRGGERGREERQKEIAKHLK